MPSRMLALLGCFVVVGCASKKPVTIPFIPSVVSPLVSPFLAPIKPLALFIEPFEELNPQRWREIEVKGRTWYTIETVDGRRCLKAHSRNGASILLSPFRFDPDTYEWLSWRWRVDQFVEGEALLRKDGSDASARIYVYFNTSGLPWQKRNLDYVWSSHLSVGTVLDSAFSRSSKIIVVDSSREHAGTWRLVHRNIEADYRQCFGEDPPDVVAIGIMADTDSTHTEAITYFADLMVSRELPPEHYPAVLP